MNSKNEHPIAYLIGLIIGWLIKIGFFGVVAWMAISLGEILFKNGNPETVYTSWNFWQLIFK